MFAIILLCLAFAITVVAEAIGKGSFRYIMYLIDLAVGPIFAAVYNLDNLFGFNFTGLAITIALIVFGFAFGSVIKLALRKT